MGGSQREKVEVLVSKDNKCDYCVVAHTAALRSIGATEEEIAALDHDLDKAGLKPVEQALIGFARRANLDPHGLGDADFQALRDAGAKDSQIVEALGVMELFLGFNNFLNSVQCEIDF